MDIKNSEISSDKAYKNALKFAKTHYENFPVVSFLVPKTLQKHIAIIYWFARTADDIADEGDFTENERLNKLNGFRARLQNLLMESYADFFDVALHSTIIEKKLSPELFFDLLSAFEQDITKKRYADFTETLSYCKRSANPVGRLILELYGVRDKEAFEYSDNICTALQIINFIQDTKIDFEKGRIYIPLDEMEKFRITERYFELNEQNEDFRRLVEFQVERVEKMFILGKNLLGYLSGRLKFEIGWTIAGGMAIADKIRENDFSVLSQRPELNKMDFVFLLLKTMMLK